MNEVYEKITTPKLAMSARKFTEYLESASDEQLFHINLYALADEWTIPRKDLLELAIRGLYGGVLKVDWEYHCPHCGGVANESLSLHSATHENWCDLCKVSFPNQLDENIEVLFSIHPGIRQLPESLTASWRSSMMDELSNAMHFKWKGDTTIYGSHLVENPVFRELLGDETLPADQSLELMHTTILFTDIRGSTRLYTDLGDSRAFVLVREHFIILFDTIREFGGVPVKTIGDAVMGSFPSNTAALRAALEAQIRLRTQLAGRPESERIEIKIGMHSGPTLIVTLNGKLDYFGTTVNMAARIQGIARPNEIVVSETLILPRENRMTIAAYTRQVMRTHAVFKGMDGEHTLYRISLSETT